MYITVEILDLVWLVSVTYSSTYKYIVMEMNHVEGPFDKNFNWYLKSFTNDHLQ